MSAKAFAFARIARLGARHFGKLVATSLVAMSTVQLTPVQIETFEAVIVGVVSVLVERLIAWGNK